MSDHKRFAQVAHQKWASMSESLGLLTKNERIACFFERIARFFLVNHSFFEWMAHSLISSQKTSDWLRKPKSESQPWIIVYLSVPLFVHWSIFCLSVRLSALLYYMYYLSTFLSLCLSIGPAFIWLPVSPPSSSIRSLTECPFISLSVICPSVFSYIFVRSLSVHLSVCRTSVPPSLIILMSDVNGAQLLPK